MDCAGFSYKQNWLLWLGLYISPYFCLYGITSREDVRFVYSTFPIVEEKEVALYGTFRSRDLCLDYINALKAGETDLTIPV